MRAMPMKSRVRSAGNLSNKGGEAMDRLDEILNAISRRDLAALERLAPGNTDLTDPEGRNSLINAILEEDPDPAIVRWLIDHGSDINAHDAGQQWTALHFAARDQNAVLVRLLLQAGAEVDPVDIFGNTPLWRSVMNSTEDLAAIKELVAHGADPYKKNHHGMAPADIARKTGRADIVAIFEGLAA